jgi:S1-C subfamily serine protease
VNLLGLNVVDLVLVGALIVFAWAGWRQGFVVGILSFAGFLGGGIAAALVLPGLIASFTDSGVLRIAAVTIGVLGCALIGQTLLSMLGRRLRGVVSWRPLRVVDNFAGAALNVLALCLIAWIIASAVAFLPSTSLSSSVRESQVLVTMDGLVPDQARDAFTGIRDLVGDSDVPRVFSGLGAITGPDVEPPDAAALTEDIAAARGSIVRVSGDADACETRVTGSGFVFSPGFILTNAHVVAGVEQPRVRIRAGDDPVRTEVVHFDPRKDIAVLRAPGLVAPALEFAKKTQPSGSSVVTVGFPQGGSFRADPARVRTSVVARGDTIYGEAGVEREVYIIRSNIEPGSSGGPLLSTTGEVVGMVFAADVTDQGVGYALTNAELKNAMDEGLAARSIANTGSCELRQ